ncbi:hypothetical protein LQ567_20965 [Niabella pedocola]|uniref:DUF4843 domain-containing protein n=1 Tax=Niabella pedocola TaxID=1752077 RepID=A0ABS8PZB0_9BACT|nr:hypothetical protein [Niabella pedocola]MCD2425271.1 hypothetical protein [Niabella pedocola]
MKVIKNITVAFSLLAILASCEDKDYPKGVEEYAHHYYLVFYPNTNDTVKVQRSQTALLKLPVQFYSAFTRDYDAVAYYIADTARISNRAVRGTDFEITDRNGNTLQPDAGGRFSITFPKAKQAKDTIYVKMLNAAAPGSRRVTIGILGNTTGQYTVDTFAVGHLRPLVIN